MTGYTSKCILKKCNPLSYQRWKTTPIILNPAKGKHFSQNTAKETHTTMLPKSKLPKSLPLWEDHELYNNQELQLTTTNQEADSVQSNTQLTKHY